MQHCVYRPLLAEQVHRAGAVSQSGEHLQTTLLYDGAADELHADTNGTQYQAGGSYSYCLYTTIIDQILKCYSTVGYYIVTNKTIKEIQCTTDMLQHLD